MSYPRFAGLIPGGKQIDLLIAHKRWDKVVKLLKAAESDLTLRRKRRSNRMYSLPHGSEQRQIDKARIDVINKRLDAICATLRDRGGIFWKTRAFKASRRPKPSHRRPH